MTQLDHTFAALRRAILARLALGEATVGELVERFDVSLPAISKHLRVLETAGLISRQKRAQQKLCKLEPEALKAPLDWIERNRRIWEERFDRLAAYLRELQGKGGGHDNRQGSDSAGQSRAGEPTHLRWPAAAASGPCSPIPSTWPTGWGRGRIPRCRIKRICPRRQMARTLARGRRQPRTRPERRISEKKRYHRHVTLDESRLQRHLQTSRNDIWRRAERLELGLRRQMQQSTEGD